MEVKVSQGKFNFEKKGSEPRCLNETMCVCVEVPLRNDFLINKGAIQAQPPKTKRHTQVLKQMQRYSKFD